VVLNMLNETPDTIKTELTDRSRAILSYSIADSGFKYYIS